MYISPLLLASACILSFSTCADARVAQHRVDLESDRAWEWKKSGDGLNNIVQKRQDLDWTTPDLYLQIIEDALAAQATNIQTFCNIWLGIPPATEVVDHTPTITFTTSGASTSTIVRTTRVMTTETVTATATVTPASIVPRAANIAAAYAVANAIITSVIESGADASPTAPAVAVLGLSTACSIKNVDPTSTVTSTFTAPPVQKTFGQNKIRFETEITTRVYTMTTTVTSSPSTLEGFSSSINASALSSSAATGSSTGSFASVIPSTDSQLSSGGSGVLANSSRFSATITSAPSVAFVSSGSIPPTALPSGPSQPVVVGIPFSCPDSDGASPRFITGDLQYQYTVLCNTAIVSDNEVTTIQSVENESACAAECSLINNAAQKDVCQAAMFTPIPGARFGSCLINGRASNFVPQQGTTTVLLTGVSSKADNCQSVELTTGPSNVTIDTAAVVASVTSAGFSLSIPGLVSWSETGGQYRTRFSSAFTATDGWVYFTWNEVYESSSAWWALYVTPRCEAPVPQTIVKQLPDRNASSPLVGITTIIDGSVTTIYSGTAVTSYTNGGGSIPPVSASTTSDGAAFTTGFSTATSNATAGGSSQGPSSTDTFGAQSSAALNLSGATATANSTGGVFGIPPALTTTVQPTVSGAVPTSSTTIGPPSSATFVTSGATSMVSSTGSGNSVGPSPTNGTLVVTLLSVTATLNSTGSGIYSTTPDVATFGISFATSTSNYTGGSGGYGEQTPVESSPPPNSTGPAGTLEIARTIISSQTFTTNSTSASALPPNPSSNQPTLPAGSPSSANEQFTSAGNTFVVSSTGGGGSFGPAAVTSNSTQLPKTVSVGLTGIISGAISTANSTGGGGSVLQSTSSGIPLSTGTSSPDDNFSNSLGNRFGNPRSTPTPRSTVGAQNLTSSGGSALTSATPPSGTIPPLTNLSSSAPASLTPSSSLNVSTSFGLGLFSASGATPVLSAASSSAAIPPSSANGSEVTSTSTGVYFTSGATTRIYSTRFSGAIVPPSTNVSETASASLIPTTTLNSSLATGTGVFSTLGGIAITSSSGSSGALPPPSANLTATTPASVTPNPSVNSSIPGGIGIFATSVGTASSSAASGNGAIPPPLNSTATTAPSLTLSLSLSSSVPIGTGVLTTSSEDTLLSAASGSGALPPPSNFTTTPVPSSTLSPSANASTFLSGTNGISLTTVGTAVVFPSVNLTTTAPASLIPVPSVNASSTTGDNFSNSLGDRIGSLRRSTSRPSATIPGTAPIGTATPVVLNSTTLPETGPSSSTPNGGYGELPSETPDAPFSLNAASTIGSSQPSITLPPVSANSSSTRPPLNTTVGTYNPDDDDRIGRQSRPRSSGLTGSVPVPTANSILSGTAPPLTAASAFPTDSANSSAPISFSTAPESGSSFLPIASINSTAGGGTASANSVNTTANSTVGPGSATAPVKSPIGTSPSSLLQPSSNGSISDMPRSGSGPASSAFRSTDSAGTVSAPSSTANSSLPIGTASSTVPSSSANITIALSTGIEASSSNLAVSANSSVSIGTAFGPIQTPPPLTRASASIGILSATVNFTSGFGTGISAVPMSSANYTVLALTSESATATVSEEEGFGGFTILQGTGSIVLPTESANSTGFFLTSVPAPSSSVPTPSANVSWPVGTESSAILTSSVNSTNTFLTGVMASSFLPRPSANATASVGTGSSAVATASANSTAFASTGGSVASTVVAPLSGNSTSFLPTGTSAASGRSTVFPTLSLNATVPASLLSSGATACPTEAPYSTILRTTVITETIPVSPSTCLFTTSTALTVNGTLPAVTGTGAPALPPSAYSSSTFDANAPTPTAPPTRRRAGEIATPEQIAAACADDRNLVYNPDFELDGGNTALSWTIEPDDAFITFRTVPSTNTNGTTNHSARVLAAAPGRYLTVSQPLTLCPGRTYRLSSFNRQSNLLSKCTADYRIGNKSVYVSSPQEAFLKRAEFFTAGSSAEDCSQDLNIRTKCDGEAGATAGADEEGFMVMEFDNVTVMPVMEGSKRKM